jgi:hypothetical protein
MSAFPANSSNNEWKERTDLSQPLRQQGTNSKNG